jgi:hypothetical protein
LPDTKASGLGTQKVLAIAAGGIGVVGLGLGAFFGVTALSKKSDAQNACPNACTSSDGVNKWSDAVSTGNISTVALIAGGVGVLGGAILWFSAPKSASSSGTQVGLAPGGLEVKGTW